MSGNNILNNADFVVNYGTMLESKIGKASLRRSPIWGSGVEILICSPW
jgi:hypothetical protein